MLSNWILQYDFQSVNIQLQCKHFVSIVTCYDCTCLNTFLSLWKLTPPVLIAKWLSRAFLNVHLQWVCFASQVLWATCVYISASDILPCEFVFLWSEVKWKSLSCVPLFVGHHGLYSPWNSPGQNTGVGSLSLLQGIFPTQELNQGLLRCRQILYQLSYEGSRHLYTVGLYVAVVSSHN